MQNSFVNIQPVSKFISLLWKERVFFVGPLDKERLPIWQPFIYRPYARISKTHTAYYYFLFAQLCGLTSFAILLI